VAAIKLHLVAGKIVRIGGGATALRVLRVVGGAGGSAFDEGDFRARRNRHGGIVRHVGSAHRPLKSGGQVVDVPDAGPGYEDSLLGRERVRLEVAAYRIRAWLGRQQGIEAALEAHQ
jgi:hypothetical protein